MQQLLKFEISLEKLSVKFEGDIQTAERMQGEITGALNTLASAQNRMLTSGAQSTQTGRPTEESAVPRRRRRRRKPSEGIDTAVLDADILSDNDLVEGDAGNGSKRSSGVLTGLITGLKNERYFTTKRTIGAIRDALSEKGHSYKTSTISPMLIKLTQDQILRREKSPQKQWVYFAE